MTTATLEARPMSRNARALIDARLDTIDRMLVGRVPRSDRLAIGRDVELQIHELLQARDGDELDRETVLEVLAQLDPPEAFLPEDMAEQGGTLPVRLAAVGTGPRAAAPASSPSGGHAPGVLGILGLVSSFLPILSWPLALLTQNEIVFYGSLAALAFPAIILGLLALIFGLKSPRRTGWQNAGAIMGGLAILGGPFMSIATLASMFLLG